MIFSLGLNFCSLWKDKTDFMLFQEKKERVFSYEKSFSMNILISSSSHFPLGGGGGGEA